MATLDSKSTLAYLLKSLPNICTEYKFYETRKWRFDWAIPEYKIAIEYEGGAGMGGRHTRIIGYTNDCEKYREAALDGWIVLRYTFLDIKNNPTHVLNDIKRAVASRRKNI